nr:putative late blight resistance protein homolog R1B-14 [Ipomoea batatas]
MVRVLDNVVEDVASKAVYKLVQTVAANIDLVHGIGSAIQDLTSDIETFNARLVDASMNPRANQLQVVKVVVKKFRAVVNEAQDAIAKYIALNKKHEDNALAKCLDFIPFPVCENTNVCANEIRSIRTKVNALFQVHEKDLVSLVSYKNNAQDNNGLKPLQDQPIVEEDYVIGFEDDLTTIKTRLIEPSNNIVFIPIVGIPGTGKTTFAYQIFKDPNILNKFVHPIWVHVSQSFDRRQKFIEILCQITKRAEDFSKVTEDQLKTRIKDLLKDKRYLIVLDDIWEKKDLDSLKVAFPNNSQGSRVLVTTRFHNVVDSIGKPHILEPLDPDVSWRILEMNIFGKEGCCNDSLKTLGEEIAKRCNGLPLALVVVAGILQKTRTHTDWKRFCKSEAGKKNLFHIMDGGKRLDVNTTSLRRLCYHSSTPNISNVEKNPSCYFLNYYNKKKSPYPSGEHVHSLLVSSLEKSDVQLNQEQLRTIPNAFPLLRVLDIESLKLNSLPDELFSLYLLKYLAITTNLKFLPKRFKNLRELQTLVFKTTESTLEIDGGIWNMEKLRHVHTNTSTQLPSPQKESKSGYRNTDIRTLSTISPASCRKEIFIKTPKLQKLGVCGDLVELLEEMQGICLFNNLQMLDALENLKLRGQSDKMLKVPKLEVFPPKLRKLTLSNTQFDWNGMIILGLLEELQVLKLDHNAFIGELWNLKDNVVFKQLQYLRIGRTNLVTWKAEKNNFPVLENLILRNCSYLEEIPYAFVDVHSLTVIELYHVSEKAVHSARKVYNLRQSKKDATTKGFDLFITSLPSEATPATAHAVENVNTSGFDLASSSILPPPTLIKMAPMVEEENVVGFDNEVKIIKDRLYRESMKLTVISIVGMVGVGKTTLAKMLFNDGDLHVASHVDSTGIPHQLKFLRNIECWELIKKKVFGDERCLTSLESVGRSIAKKCNGLPLAVVLIIPVLRENRTLTEWGRIAKDPFASIDYENQHYNPLMELMDSQLKDCFLYLAAFPMRLEIDAGKLIHLWMAEGFIPEGELEHTAEKFLNDFVQRNLLIVSKRRADGRIKMVSIHELLHAICIREAAKQNFIREFDVLGGVSNSTFTKGYRRLSVHSSVLQDLSEIIKPSSIDEQVQSFLYFSSDTLEFPKAPLASIPNSFPNLKVLDIRSVEVPVPKEFYRLQHLAYLGISVHFNLNLLPVEFGNLSQLQTLVLHSTTQSALKIEADIWSMPKLRHVLSNTPVHLPTPIRRSTNSSGSAHIRTLSTISPTSCTGEILDKTPNLQKLGIRGNIVEVMESKKGISLFDNLQKLRNLENLKLLVHTINGQASLLRSFPRADKFPRRLRKLTLSNTSFEWKDLCVLGALNELEVLKLEEYAFKGEAWELKNVVFRCLKFLRIGRTNLAHWTTSRSCFPVLKTLIIRHCAGLTAVPSDLADVHSLELLELFYTNKAAVNSARDIEILKHERGNAHSSGFKLSIYPSDH